MIPARPTLLVLAPALLAAVGHAQLAEDGVQLWNADSPGLTISAQQDGYFGRSLAAGDFDDDGYPDLAIGIPGQDLGGATSAGAVLVLYSGSGGPGVLDSQLWTEDDLGIGDGSASDDRFGWSLATGDFDGDGYDDLAVGAPFEPAGAEGGVAFVLYGGPDGLATAGAQIWTQDTPGVPDATEAGDLFAYALVAGDFDHDGYDDLAIGVPGEDLESPPGAANLGQVDVLFGAAAGLGTADARAAWPGDGQIALPQGDGAIFGYALAAGRLTTAPIDYLVAGAPGLEAAGQPGAGWVAILLYNNRSEFGISVLRQGVLTYPGTPETGDGFGSSLAIGDFDADRWPDLAVGIPFEDDDGNGASNAGAVQVFHLFHSEPNSEIWTQADLPPETPEDGDLFGYSLATADFDADGHAELVIGAPGESLTAPAVANAGEVHVLRGSPSGLTAAGAQTWKQLVSPPGEGHFFGTALATGSLSGHSGADLAIGAPYDVVGGQTGAGSVDVLFSDALFRDGFETGDTSRWQAPL